MLKNYDPPESISNINITPFVDVLLVLLVIFMITAPITTKTLEVKLPEENLSASNLKSPQKFVVSINQEGITYLNEKIITDNNLAREAGKWKINQPKKAAFVKADKRVNYGKVVEIMALLKNNGISDVGLLIQHKERN